MKPNRMKKAVSVLGVLSFVLVIFFPAGVLISGCFGYTFSLGNYPAFAVVTALLWVVETFLCVRAKGPDGGALPVLFAIATPLALVDLVLYMVKSNSAVASLCLLLCCGCSCFLAAKYGKPLALKVVSLVLSGLMAVPIGFFALFWMTFGQIGQNTVVITVPSPDGAYYAEVIDSDQGALGGDTYVDVYDTRGIDALLFRISKPPRHVYSGDWKAYEEMSIYWKDARCLVVNGTEHIMD